MNETITKDLVQEVFNDTIYPELKEYIETNSIYSRNQLVNKNKPTTQPTFPIILVKLLPSTNVYGNLNYSEERFNFGIEIDINAQDKTVNDVKVSKRTICEELTSWIITYFKTNYRVIITSEPNAPTTDETVHRAVIRVSGVIDTKYGLDKLIIYPK